MIRAAARAAAIGALISVSAVAARAQNTGAVQSGIVVSPDTVTVGEPFIARIRVHAPVGAAIVFPGAPDSSARVELLDSPKISPNTATDAVDQTAAYRMVAWDIGAMKLALADARVVVGSDTIPVSLAAAQVFVKSVLPADTALRIPKPPRPPLTMPTSLWRLWLALAALALLLALLFWWWRRRQKRPPAPVPVVDAFEQAQKEFARVESLGLLEAGERGRFVALMVEVLRDYLAGRIPGARTSLTSTELLTAVGTEPTVPAERLWRLLAEADLIKFARRPLTVERARELGLESRAVVNAIEEARNAVPKADAA